MNLAPVLRQRFFDANGLPLAGGNLYSYAAGTTTPQATYSNATGTTNTNPVVLDSNGYADVFLDTTLAYKFVLEDANSNVLWTVDNVTFAVGITSWNANAVYSQGNLVIDSSGQGQLYVSLTNNNQNNALTSVSNWRMFDGNIRTVSTNTTLAVTDGEIRSNSTSGTLTHTLPACSTTSIGKKITIKDVGTGSNTTKIKGAGSDTVDGNNTYIIALKQYASVTVENTGSTWDVVSSSPNFIAPTVRKFTSTGTTTGYLFTISTSTTCAVGDTYTNNANTYTVLGALSAQSGQVLFTSGAAAPASSGTLSRASGSGTSSVSFSASAPLATYVVPSGPGPLYLKATLVGPGGGGGGTGTSGAGGGQAGQVGTWFGCNLLSALGGGGGTSGTSQGPGTLGGSGGTAAIGQGLVGIAMTGNAGGAAGQAFQTLSGYGGQSVFGGGASGVASGGSSTAVGIAAATNSGSGGSGAISPDSSHSNASGGGAGGFVQCVLVTPSPGGTYPYCVGTGGGGGGNGVSGSTGGAGADGLLYIEEYYQ